MIDLLYKLLDFCLIPFRMYSNPLIMIPLALLTALFIVGLFMRLLRK